MVHFVAARGPNYNNSQKMNLVYNIPHSTVLIWSLVSYFILECQNFITKSRLSVYASFNTFFVKMHRIHRFRNKANNVFFTSYRNLIVQKDHHNWSMWTQNVSKEAINLGTIIFWLVFLKTKRFCSEKGVQRLLRTMLWSQLDFFFGRYCKCILCPSVTFYCPTL